MKILLIHTCGVEGSVAIADTGLHPGVMETALLPPRTFSEALLPAVRLLLDRVLWSVRHLDAIGVVNGPGSFTGVRTGLSAAKGLCEAENIPLITVSRLALLAATAGEVHALLDAGRGEFYLGTYRNAVKVREALVAKAEIEVLANAGTRMIACEQKVLASLPGIHLEMRPEPLAGEALALIRTARAAGANDILGDANYLRRIGE